MSEEKVTYEVETMAEDIQLPHDYDRYYVGLNEEIRNLIRQAIESRDEVYAAEIAEKDAKHAREIDEIKEMYTQRLEVAEKAVAELRERLNEMTQLHHEKLVEVNRLSGELRVSQQAQREAEEKRDNAVKAMEEAQAEAQRLREENQSLKRQINELEGMLRTYKARKPVGGLQLVSTLPELSNEELEERRKREKLEQLNRILERKGYGAIRVPPLPSTDPVDDVTEEDIQHQEQRVAEAYDEAKETFPMVSSDAGMDPVSDGAEAPHEDVRSAGVETSAGDATSLEARVAALEARVNRLEERLAG